MPCRLLVELQLSQPPREGAFSTALAGSFETRTETKKGPMEDEQGRAAVGL